MVPAIYSFIVLPFEICANHLDTVGVHDKNQKIQLAAVAPEKYSLQKLPVIAPVIGEKLKSVRGVEITAKNANTNTRKAIRDIPFNKLRFADNIAIITVIAASMN